MARRLAWSLDVHAPGLPRAVITDVPTHALSSCFEHVIEFRPGASGVFGEKVRLDSYSPFAETLFIDADSLVVGNLDDVWELMRQVPFAVIGHQSTSGRWYGDVAQMAAAVGANSLPLFNGGLYYFNESAAARSVFATARHLMNRYEELGLADHLIGHAEEPVVAMALAKHGIEALDDGGTDDADADRATRGPRHRRSARLLLLRQRGGVLAREQPVARGTRHASDHALRGVMDPRGSPTVARR